MPDISLEQKYEVHKQLAAKLNPTYRAKNTDYDDSLGKSITSMGYAAAIVRMEDKMNRTKALLLNPERNPQVDESVLDTLMDLANYALMTATEYSLRVAAVDSEAANQ